MKKITLLLSFITCVVLANAQTNLLSNPGFETWTNGTTPDNWTISGAPTGYTVTPESTLTLDGTKSFNVNVSTSASGTISWSQSISVVAGKTYTLTMNYYIVSGDGTDARIWCNFKSGSTYFIEADVVATGQYSKLRGPGCENSSGTTYFPDVKSSWQTYTTDITIPSNADGIDFQFRTYKGAIVNWDKFSLTEKLTALTTPSANLLDIKLAGKKLTVLNSNSAIIEIFNTSGAKVLTAELNNNSVDLNLSKGLYIVKAANKTSKMLLK
jgi:hypothetical protein